MKYTVDTEKVEHFSQDAEVKLPGGVEDEVLLDQIVRKAAKDGGLVKLDEGETIKAVWRGNVRIYPRAQKGLAHVGQILPGPMTDEEGEDD